MGNSESTKKHPPSYLPKLCRPELQHYCTSRGGVRLNEADRDRLAEMLKDLGFNSKNIGVGCGQANPKIKRECSHYNKVRQEPSISGSPLNFSPIQNIRPRITQVLNHKMPTDLNPQERELRKHLVFNEDQNEFEYEKEPELASKATRVLRAQQEIQRDIRKLEKCLSRDLKYKDPALQRRLQSIEERLKLHYKINPETHQSEPIESLRDWLSYLNSLERLRIEYLLRYGGTSLQPEQDYYKYRQSLKCALNTDRPVLPERRQE